ncbi:uncharacterized protein [Fopius arisanus]|uniref:RBP-2_0 protein n=1 Tax=Fopius arisanus TaxID=64838 RepID=A0A0C9RN18_9HYME|nr:PREDICTED: uncharacterized protein LOC105268161 [Fopius arisanus]XP_011305780.1 PREDICTED: uncharacterized protein LOC105268161 [Fopius arisanus]
MGASTSLEEGFTLENMLEQTNRILREATEVITKCLEMEKRAVEDYEKLAVAQIESAFQTIQEKLSEISKRGAIARQCIDKKTSEFTAIRTTMKCNLLECYNKHDKAMEKLKNERSSVHNDASQFKIDAQKILENCLTSGDTLDCLRSHIGELAKQGSDLLKKFDALVKLEAEERIKWGKLVVQCDKRAIEETQKQATKIIQEIIKCCLVAESTLTE